MMKIFLVMFCFCSTFIGKSSTFVNSNIFVINVSKTLNIKQEQINKDRKLSEEEVKKRGLDGLVNGVIENIEDIDIRKIARSHIIETSYGFKWKLFNVASSLFIVVKVDKKFNLISASKMYL